jgi:hypothetical protein
MDKSRLDALLDETIDHRSKASRCRRMGGRCVSSQRRDRACSAVCSVRR